MKSNCKAYVRRMRRLVLLFVFVLPLPGEGFGIPVDLRRPGQVYALDPLQLPGDIGLGDRPVQDVDKQGGVDQVQVERTNGDFGSWRRTGIVKDPPGARAKVKAIMATVEARQRRMVQAVREACGAG